MNTTAFLLQSATGITLKCDRIITNCESLVYYKLRQLSYKMLHGLLKIVTGITKDDGFSIKIATGRFQSTGMRQYPGLVPSPHWWNLGNARNVAWEGVFLLSFPWCNVNSLKPSHQSSRKTREAAGYESATAQGPGEYTLSHLSQSWSHLVGQSSCNNHYISLTLKKAEKK